ncbi:MAG TPA: helix-turn-helix domain-containing protein, partial [Thermomicrobiales bacterium]|nr:helix-turn-helix domain-containing protein [Thermomicrobiales bacterium]
MAGFGETLRQARAHKGVTLKEAEQATRINRHHLAALEEEDFGALPPLIYQRGIVRNYAVYLDLDPSKLLGMFEEAQGTTTATAAGGVAPVPPIDMPSHWAPNFAIIAFAVVLSAIVFAWGYSIYVAPPSEDPTATVESANTTPLASTIDLPTELPATPAPPT